MRRLLKPLFRPLSERLDRIHRHLDDLDRQVAEVTDAVERNHEAILAARHHMYTLLVQDLDAGSEATTLLSRGLQDTRTAIGDAVDELRLEIDKLRDELRAP